jgi:hypothetical protein
LIERVILLLIQNFLFFSVQMITIYRDILKLLKVKIFQEREIDKSRKNKLIMEVLGAKGNQKMEIIMENILWDILQTPLC